MGDSRQKRIPPFGVALFGVGRIGTVHFRSLASNFRVKLLWIVEEDVKKAQALVDQYDLHGVTKVVPISGSQEVYNDSRVDAVVVCTPSSTHDSIVKASLITGKSVFCEKPVTLDSTSTLECYETAEQYGQTLMCGFQRRWDPQIRAIYNKKKAGELGKVRMIKSISWDATGLVTPGEILISGELFHSSSIHDIDTVRWLAGERPVSVYAVGHASDPEVAAYNDLDTGVAILSFPSGLIATINVGRNSPGGYDQRVEVCGTLSVVQTVNKRHVDLVCHSIEGTLVPPIINEFTERYADAYKLEMEHFLDVIQGKAEVEVQKFEVLDGMDVADACARSRETGQPVVLPTRQENRVGH